MTKLIAKETIRPVRHDLGRDREVLVAAFVSRQIGSELVAHAGTDLAPGRIVHRHGEETALDAAVVELHQQAVEVMVQDRQRMEPVHVGVDSEGLPLGQLWCFVKR